MPAGRPTKYTKAIQKFADEYVDGGYINCGDVVPSVAGLSVELKVGRNTLRDWGKAHPDFSTTLDRLRWVQERVALSGGLKNEFNSTITKLLLANHGYTDKVESHQTGDASTTIIVKTHCPEPDPLPGGLDGTSSGS